MMQIEDSATMRKTFDPWWIFLLSGAIWFLIALVVLRMNITSVPCADLRSSS
jgi:hypothetical protein